MLTASIISASFVLNRCVHIKAIFHRDRSRTPTLENNTALIFDSFPGYAEDGVSWRKVELDFLQKRNPPDLKRLTNRSTKNIF
jgi:hypothetical protein